MTSLLNRFLRPFTSMATTTEPMALPTGAQRATVAAGCFWGVEHLYRHNFTKEQGLLDARVGYIGGNSKHPSYRAVCSGSTGHAEALQIVFDPEKLSYQSVLEFFFRMHDPTTKDAQGPDRGSQYRSAIFFHDDEQERIARDIADKVGKQWWKQGKVVTEILPAGEWWDAEAYHQKYLDVNPGGYECPSHFLRKFPKLE